MTLFVRPPFDPVLSGFVRCLWYCERTLPPGKERVLPAGIAQVIVDLSDAAEDMPNALVTGPQTTAALVDTAAMRRSAGVAFRVGGASALIALPCSSLTDRAVDLAALWGRDTGRLWRALKQARGPADLVDRLEAFLVRRLPETRPPTGAVRQAVRDLGGGQPVAAVVEASGLARATFGRLFTREVGLSPKQWSGIARFQRAVGRLADGTAPLADVAAACGYADQAHLTRAFRRYAGITPAAYRPRSVDEPNHLTI